MAELLGVEPVEGHDGAAAAARGRAPHHDGDRNREQDEEKAGDDTAHRTAER